MIIKNRIQKGIISHLELGPDTKSNLASKFNVSITAITSHINELKAKGYLLEKESTLHTGGRIPKLLELNTKGKYTIGISFTKNSFNIIILSLGKEVIDSVIIEQHFNTFEEYLKAARDEVHIILKKNNIDYFDIIATGVSMPGPVDNKTTTIEYVNFGYKNIEYSILKKYLGENIFIENEANLAILYEKYLRNIPSNELIVHISANDGIGAGIYSNSSFLKSNLGYAGEIGNTIIDYKNKTSAEDLIGYTKIIESYNIKCKNSVSSLDDLLELSRKKDVVAIQIYETVILVLKTIVHNIKMTLDPSMIIINGKIISSLGKYTNLDTLLLDDYCNKKFSSKTQVILSTNKNTTTCGAALFALEVVVGQFKL